MIVCIALDNIHLSIRISTQRMHTVNLSGTRTYVLRSAIVEAHKTYSFLEKIRFASNDNGILIARSDVTDSIPISAP